MQHVARRAAAAHLGDLLAGLHQLALVDQARAVVAIGGQPLVAVLEDHQLAVADQAGTGIHHHPVGGGAHRLPALAGDVDALPGGIAIGEARHHHPIRRPAPADVAGRGNDHRRRCGRLRNHRRTGLRRRPRGRPRRHPALPARVQAQALPGMDGVGRRDVVPQRQVERGQSVFGGDAVHVLTALHHHRRAVLRLRDPHRPLAGGCIRRGLAGHVAAPAGGQQRERAAGDGNAVQAHAADHAACPRNASQPMAAASSASAPQPIGSM